MRTLLAGFVGLMVLVGSAAVAPAQTYKVDPVHSFIVFKIEHMNTGWVWGRFNGPTGTFNLDADNPQNSSFDVSVEAQALDTANKDRDAHLRSDDFFNAEAHPTITFKSTKVEKGDNDTLKVTGDITLLGKTKPVTVAIKTGDPVDANGGKRVGVNTTFTVKRSDYGMNFMPEAIGDEVELHVALEGVTE